MSSTLCSKCGEINAQPIEKYCTKCGEPPANGNRPGSARRHVEYGDKLGTKVNEVTLSSLSGKSVAEETKELLAWARQVVPDAPMDVAGYTDGITICKLLIEVAPSAAKPRYNPRPKMVLQKLNNVSVACDTMQTVGMSTEGINMKDVVDGNEKEIMNLLRMLHLYSRRAKGHSRRGSMGSSPLQPLSPSANSFNGAALAAAAERKLQAESPRLPKAASPVAEEPKKAPEAEPAKPPSRTQSPRKPAKLPEMSLAELDAERLKQQQLQQEAELRSLDEKIAAMNARLETLSEERDAEPILEEVDDILDERKGLEESVAVPGVTVTSTENVLKVVRKSPRNHVPDSESSTEGEEDSASTPQQTPREKREAALAKLRQWKEESNQESREKAETEAVNEIRAVAAGVVPPPTTPPPEDSTPKTRSRKGPRRRRRRPRKTTSSASVVPTDGSDEEDSGISDSPDASDDEGTTSPLVARAPDSPHMSSKRDSGGSGSGSGRRVKVGRAKKRGSLAVVKEAIKVAEAEVDGVLIESEAIRKEREEVERSGGGALLARADSDGQGKWYVSPLKQEELRSFGEDPVFTRGVTRVQAMIRGKAARRKRKLLAKRVFIAREVVESEKTYVRNLKLCIEHFFEPMSKLSYISDLQLRQMFSEISVIHGYNQHLCGQLESRQKDWVKNGQKLGDIFLGFVAYFRTYTAYVNNYNDAMGLFYQLQAKNKAFQSFLAEKKVDAALNGQELPAFLIMPIQRLPRYVMLLEDLLRNTPKDHADYNDLATALNKVQAVADYVNEKKREAENVNQVLDVQARLTGMGRNLAEPHRRFVRQGSVLNMDKKGETMLFLFNDILVTGKESHGLGKLTEKGKEMLGFSKKGSSTPKLSRKAGMSPFFGKKKPQLQAEVDDREYKYQKTISLADVKVSAQFGASAQGGAAQASHFSDSGTIGRKGSQAMTPSMDGFLLTLKTPVDHLHFATQTEEELNGWLHDLDATAMRLVERKRIRCERTAKHHDGALTFLEPVGGRHVVNKADASFSGRVMLKVPATGKYEWKYVCLLKPHLYVFNSMDDEEPQGWLYLLTSHVVLGKAEANPVGWSYRLHVPHSVVPSASTWMAKQSVRVKGHAGNPDSSSPLDKDVAMDEDQDRDVYDFIGLNVNDVLNWCREIRNVILDSVKLPDDLCPLEVIQKTQGEENESCADCGFVPTKYASVNLGVFLCAACAELHHEVLDGISLVRDVKEAWDITPQQRFELEALMGNAKRNKIFEKNASKKDVPKAKGKTIPREARARWIKAKYVMQGVDKDMLGSSFGGSGGTPGSRRLSSATQVK